TTKYMPSEKTTMCQGAPRKTLFRLITFPRAATASNKAAAIAATALTGTPKGSNPKNTISNRIKTTQPALKVTGSLIAFNGSDKLAKLYVAGISRLKNTTNTHRLAKTDTKLTGIIIAA